MTSKDGMPPAIIVSGLTMALGVVRALGTLEVPVTVLHYDRRDIAHRSRWCSDHRAVPHPETREADFIEALLAYAAAYGGGVLFPVSDESVVAIAKNKAKLDDHYRVACPPWQTARLCIDKQWSYAIAEANGVPAPLTFNPSSLADVEQYASRAAFPCLVKPRQSHLCYTQLHRKMTVVHNIPEMVSAYQEARAAGLDVMLQEIIPGDDTHVINYNAYFHHGNAIVEFTAEHIRNAPPSWGSPRVALSKNIPEVIGPGRKLFRALNFDGYACTEFKRDGRDGVYKLMDINARHNLSTLLAVRCGLNFPWLHYRHLAFGELPSSQGFREGVYWIDLTRDIGYSARYATTERYSPSEYLRPYLRPHVFAILDLKDPAPFLARCAVIVLQGVRGILAAARALPAVPQFSRAFHSVPPAAKTLWRKGLQLFERPAQRASTFFRYEKHI